MLISGALHVVAGDSSPRTGRVDLGQIDTQLRREFFGGRRGVDAATSISLRRLAVEPGTGVASGRCGCGWYLDLGSNERGDLRVGKRFAFSDDQSDGSGNLDFTT